MTPEEIAETEAIVSVRLPVGLRDALRAEAESHQRSMSGQVRWLIERSLARPASVPAPEIEAA